MAEGMNKVILIGNLGQDPELRFTQSNQAVLSVRMATSESYFDKESNQRKELTEWHTVIVWGKRGEALSKILSKGSRIAVEGRLKTRSWEDKNGAKRYTTEIVASNVVLLGGSNRAAEAAADRGNQPDYGPGDPNGSEWDSDDIPF